MLCVFFDRYFVWYVAHRLNTRTGTYPCAVTLADDARGRLTNDEAGNTYTYDATDWLIAQAVGHNAPTQWFYRGEELVHEIEGERHRTYSKIGHTNLAVREGGMITVLEVDQSDRVVYTQVATGATSHQWMPYGAGDTSGLSVEFNGERNDSVCGTYHLGNGYSRSRIRCDRDAER